MFAVSMFTTVAIAQETTGSDKNQVERTDKKKRMGRGRGFRGDHGKRGGRSARLRGLRRLDLSDVQKSQIKTIYETSRNSQQPFREEARSLHMKRKDGTATESDIQRMQELRSQRKEAVKQLEISILALLTPDQVQQLDTMKAERKQRMEERRQRRMERKQQTDEPVKTDN